jgi:P27 family predicted phage terminase small subunit
MREVESMGINITTDKGELKRNPACGVVNECASKIQSYGGELGLSPVARSRLEGPSGSQKADDFGEF